MIVKIIKNDSDYQEALQLLSKLIQEPSAPNSDIDNTIEVLLLVIKDYEQKFIEPIEVDPVEAIKFRMSQMNLKNKDLVKYIGSISKVSEILNRKRSLSLAMIRKLHAELEIPLESLINKKEKSIESVTSEKLNYSLFPIQEMKKRGYFKNLPKNLKDYAEDLIKDYCFGYENVLDQNFGYLRAPLHIRGKKKIDKYALAIWQICVLKKAENLALIPYDPNSINEKWLRELIGLSVHEDGPKLAREALALKGIALIIEPHFNKTYLDGAAMMYKGRPIIALTLRHNRIDNFWFVLIHELAHLIKHLNHIDTQIYFDDLDEDECIDEIEKEADAIANESLIPKDQWKNLKIPKKLSEEEIHSLAKKIGVSPAIIAGRIRHERKDYSVCPKLVNKKVKL